MKSMTATDGRLPPSTSHFAPPFVVTGDAWRWYLHFGSYALVLAFFAIEYAYRRWHLRHIEHIPAPQFVKRLVQRWPALARTVMDDDA